MGMLRRSFIVSLCGMGMNNIIPVYQVSVIKKYDTPVISCKKDNEKINANILFKAVQNIMVILSGLQIYYPYEKNPNQLLLKVYAR